MKLHASLAVLLIASVDLHAACGQAARAVSEAGYAPTGGYDQSAITANAGGAFGVWTQTHAGFGMITHYLRGLTLDGSGRPRGPVQRDYVPSMAVVDVATDGRDYLIAGQTGSSTAAALVDAGGEPRSGTMIITQPPSSTPTGVVRTVWNGAAYVVFATNNALSRAELSLISAAGELTATTTAAEQASAAALVPAGTGRVLAISRSGSEVRAAFFTGVAVEGPARVIASVDEDAQFSLAADGAGYLLAWIEQRSGRVRGLLLGSDGLPAGTPLEIGTALDPYFRGVRAVPERGDFLVMWSSAGTSAVRITPNGGVGAAFVVTEGQLSSAAASGEGTIILAREGCGRISSHFLAHGASRATASVDISTAALGLSLPTVITTAAGRQIIWGEAYVGFVACFTERPLLTAFVRHDGQRAIETLTSPGATAGQYASARVDQTTFVVWSEYPGGSYPGVLRVARFDSEGRRLSLSDLAATRFVGSVKVVASGSRVLVAWTQYRETVSTSDLFAVFLDESGAVSEGPLLMSRADEDPYWVVAASNGPRSLLGWITWLANRETEMVTLEIGASLRQVRRRTSPMPANFRSFLAAEVSDHAAVILASTEDGTQSGLAALRSDFSITSVFPIPTRWNSSARLAASGQGWTLFLAEGDERETTIHRLPLSETLEFGSATALACVPAGPWAVAFDTEGALLTSLAYIGFDPAAWGANRIYSLEGSPRRRAVAR